MHRSKHGAYLLFLFFLVLSSSAAAATADAAAAAAACTERCYGGCGDPRGKCSTAQRGGAGRRTRRRRGGSERQEGGRGADPSRGGGGAQAICFKKTRGTSFRCFALRLTLNWVASQYLSLHRLNSARIRYFPSLRAATRPSYNWLPISGRV